MRRAVWLMMLGILAAPRLAFAQAPAVAHAEQCLRAKVQRVVTVSPDPSSAADFLLKYACAEEVYRATRYETNLQIVKIFQTLPMVAPPVTDAKGAPITTPQGGIPKPQYNVASGATVDPETGEVSLPPPTAESAGTQPFMRNLLQSIGSGNSQIAGNVVPVDLRVLAGELVLEARERQARPRP